MQRGGGQLVEQRVGPVVEVQRRHRAGEELGVHRPILRVGAVLPRLDLGQQLLRATAQPWDAERVRIRLLALVRGAAADDVTQLLARAVGLDQLRDRRGVVAIQHAAYGSDHVPGRDRVEVDIRVCADDVGAVTQPALERRFELGAYVEKAQVPLELRVDAWQLAVVQLVGEVQRELGVVADRIDRPHLGGRSGHASLQQVEDPRRHRTARPWQREVADGTRGREQCTVHGI